MSEDEAYWENLPSECPPKGANDCAIGPLFRLIATGSPSSHCFASHAALQRPKPMRKNFDDCRWASCSMFKEMAPIRDLLKLKNVRKRYSHVAEVNLPEKAGRHIITDAHVDFWCYSDFDICSAVNAVEPI